MTEVQIALAAIGHSRRRAEAHQLDDLFQRVTGWAPQLWDGRLIGYGRYRYSYQSGREGEFTATGFCPLASKFSIHILPGYNQFPDIAARLGKFKRTKSCWYVNQLGDIDTDVLSELIRAGLADLRQHWTVQAT